MKKFTLPKDGGLIEEGLPNGVKHTFERIPAHIFEDEDAASERLAEKIAEDAAAGCDFDTVVEKVEAYQNQVHTLFSLESLTNLARNGRVNPAVAKIAGMLGIRLIGFAKEGRIE